ncbi:hypothetical protein FO519_009284 [Halicephalobus sp. NKZ332]|nr:hypothetical protein FO519_009284 [Halicephalobus sp. NKZ332]
MEDGTRDSPNIKSIILEIHVASSILCLSDVHERNCGFYNGKASIFDFCVPEGEYEMNLNHFQTRKPQCVDTMVNVRSVGKMSAFAQTIDANERMKFGQNIVQKWNISERVDVAVNEVTSIKERIRAKGGIIEDTNDFNKPIRAVSIFNFEAKPSWRSIKEEFDENLTTQWKSIEKYISSFEQRVRLSDKCNLTYKFEAEKNAVKSLKKKSTFKNAVDDSGAW